MALCTVRSGGGGNADHIGRLRRRRHHSTERGSHVRLIVATVVAIVVAIFVVVIVVVVAIVAVVVIAIITTGNGWAVFAIMLVAMPWFCDNA